jgi:hypothetical protein
MVAENMALLIGFWVCAGVSLFLLVAGLTAMNILRWKAAQKKAEEEYQASKLTIDGRRLPPIGRGLCIRCQKVFDQVYHMPDHTRVCPACYDALYPTP